MEVNGRGEHDENFSFKFRCKPNHTALKTKNFKFKFQFSVPVHRQPCLKRGSRKLIMGQQKNCCWAPEKQLSYILENDSSPTGIPDDSFVVFRKIIFLWPI